MKKRRVIEYDWLKVLVRFRSDIVRCSCGNEVFLENGKNIPCDSCGKMTEIKNKIVFSEYQIPAVAGTRIYRIQMGTVNYEDALNPVASVLANPQNKEDIRIRNVSGVTWSCTTPSGQKKTLEGQEMAPIKKGICFKAYEKIFEIQ